MQASSAHRGRFAKKCRRNAISQPNTIIKPKKNGSALLVEYEELYNDIWVFYS